MKRRHEKTQYKLWKQQRLTNDQAQKTKEIKIIYLVWLRFAVIGCITIQFYNTILLPVAAERFAASNISITIILYFKDDWSSVPGILFCNTAAK